MAGKELGEGHGEECSNRREEIDAALDFLSLYPGCMSGDHIL